MAERGNGELVQSFYDNFQAGDIDAVVALLSPEFELVYSGPSVIPCAGTWKGHAGFRRWAEAGLQGHLPPESVDFEEFVVQGDKVVVPGHVHVRVKTTGKLARPTSSTSLLCVMASSRAGATSSIRSPWPRRT